jgi:peptide/nickel transport system permease protein
MQVAEKRNSAVSQLDAKKTKHQSQLWTVWLGLRKNRIAMFGAVLLAALVISALIAPVVAPYDPLKTAIGDRLLAPSRAHLMGTDQFGRDTFSRVLYGGRTSLWLGIVAVSISVFIGGVLGLISGYYGSAVDVLISRFIDLMLAMPRILLALIIVFTLGVGIVNVMIAVGISGIPGYARIVRSSVLSAREQVYVEAALVVGVPNWRIMMRHISPNVIAPVLVVATLGLGEAILAAAGLSFLGLGARPPVIEWGYMISEGRDKLSVAWWLMTFPGIAIMLTVIAINLLGDGLRDALDPRLRSR